MATDRVFSLLDGNNFYASVITVFNPGLAGKPVCVLGNNEGAVVARSEEAKALGIKMGQPWHEVKHLELTAGLRAFSANFELIGDMSSRMMEMAEPLGYEQEQYSVDECFSRCDGIPNLKQHAVRIREQILQGLGISTCVGIGESKTLAKLANHIAKDAARKPGSYPAQLANVCSLVEMTDRQRDWLFARTPVEEIWGVGPRISKKLHDGGIKTAYDLMRVDTGTIRRLFSVVLERTVLELNGISCIDLETAPPPKQQIACTRSFGAKVKGLQDLEVAISEFASRVSKKLRDQQGVVRTLMVFIATSRFRKNDPQYSRCVSVPLARPTSDTLAIVGAALAGLRSIFKPGYNYARAGVMLVDIGNSSMEQGSLELGELDLQPDRSRRLMGALDQINSRFGRGTLKVASATDAPQAEKPAWCQKQDMMPPRYTTRSGELLVIKAN